MKKLLLFCLLWQSLPAFSQTKTAPAAITNFQTYGYVDDVRLDSLNAEYATIEWGFSSYILATGNQSQEEKKQLLTKKESP